jgi:hypothetical protein
MPSPGVRYRVALVRSDISEERILRVKNAVSCGEIPCGSCEIRRFRGTYRFHHQVKRISDQR